jgi:hypothetical protein
MSDLNVEEIVYVFLFRCGKCNRPITSWMRTPLRGGYSLEQAKAKAFSLSCVKECGWTDGQTGNKAVEVFQAPWTYALVQSK